jgi:hypothetical protein
VLPVYGSTTGSLISPFYLDASEIATSACLKACFIQFLYCRKGQEGVYITENKLEPLLAALQTSFLK